MNTRSALRFACARWLTGALLAATAGCVQLEPIEAEPDPLAPAEVEAEVSALSGENQCGENLGGSNLGGANLGGANLGGANLGGSNLGGNNLGGSNLGGTNLGGNNLGGVNLGGSNLGGANLGGVNLGGANLAGINLGGSNLGGSNLGGSNLGGNNLAGTNLGGSNLGGSNTGRNIHALTGSANGMLYSAEDMWLPRTGQCIVMGLGSTAFAKLLGQQSANARISVALGKLPWGFATVSGGSKTLDAWEAVVWGDRTYCSFVLAAPTATTWTGVAGFIKAVFRWQAPPTQAMDISGIEASLPHDPTVQTATTTYTGMMNAAARFRAGTLTAKVLMAGELAFISATTNNKSVNVDFASWAQDSSKNALVLGNVQSSPAPTRAESVYIAFENPDGSIRIGIASAASMATTLGGSTAGVTDSLDELLDVYGQYVLGLAARPAPRRCAGNLILSVYGVPFDPGKCDAGVTFIGASSVGARAWSTVAGTTAPFRSYMALTQSGGGYKRQVNSTVGYLTVLSETYIHLWEPAFDYVTPPAATISTGGTITASHNGTSPEDKSKAFDGSTDTKWFVRGSTTPWIVYDFAGTTSKVLTSYSLTSANDMPSRDPRAWVIEGSSNGTSWTVIDTKSSSGGFASRNYTYAHLVTNSVAYPMYRFRVTATNGSADFQIADIKLIGY